MRAIVLASTALVLASTASAQTIEERLDKARTEVNTVENAAARAQTAIKAGNLPKATLEINATKNAASRALYAIDKAREAVTPPPTGDHDGGPAPVAGYVPSPSLSGGTPLLAAFPIEQGLQKAWGSGAIPGIYNVDEGAFRFTCGGEGQIKADDPLLYAKQPGKSHWHKFWGNLAIDANSNPEALPAGQTNCNYGEKPLNLSGYWMPLLVDDQNMARNPDLVSVYYKRKRLASKFCQEGSAVRMGICVPLPDKIRFIFGWDPTKPDLPGQGMSWYCTTGTGAHVKDLDALFNSGCVGGATMVADLAAGNCWDGKNLDTPDHRSHIAFGSYGSWGYYKCPETHPYVIPQTENKVMWTVTADMIGVRSDGTKYSRVRLASDHMKPNAKPGETMHADYIEQWVAAVKKMWHDNCIEKGLSCNGGDLGNGLQLVGAQQPSYGWVNPNSRVAIP